MTPTADTRARPSRRTVARTGAWAVPAMLTAVGAPAYAASGPCTDRGTGVLACPPATGGGSSGDGGGHHHHGDGGSGSSSDCVVSSFAFDPSGATAQVAIAATDAQGDTIAMADDNGRIRTTPYTPSWPYLNLHHDQGMQQGDTLTLTLTFSEVVRGLTLRITDIDQDPGSWIDQIVVQTPGFDYLRGSQVTGSGTAADPFVATQDGRIDDSQDTAADGDVTLTWPGPVTRVQLAYLAADSQNDSSIGQHIGVGMFAYDSCPPGP